MQAVKKHAQFIYLKKLQNNYTQKMTYFYQQMPVEFV